MNFLKKIVDKNFDESVHLQFQKFSKGEFRDKAIIEAKNSNGKYTIKTSAEFANELARIVAQKLGSEKTKVTGAIISTQDLKGELEFKNVKQFQGVKTYIIDNEMSGDEIINLLEKFPKNFLALTFSAAKDETSLKVKPKAPKSAKSGKGSSEGRPKADFCVLKTKDKELAQSFVFERPEFKKAEILHNYLINSIEIPEELKGSDDFALIREKSRRVGKILRKALIDEKEIDSELDFSA